MTDKNNKGQGNGCTESGAAPVGSMRETVHALNNVLAVIQLNASMALDNLSAGQAVEGEIREIQAAVDRGRALILKISAAHAGASSPAPDLGRHIEPQAMARGISVPENGGGKRILFVDDEKELAMLGQRLLTKNGYQVSFFTDSREALRVFAADPEGYDLVITDQNMPELNGIELASSILRIRPEIPILLCTGYSTGFSRWNFKEHGFCELLVKPYQPAELLSTVRTLFIR